MKTESVLTTGDFASLVGTDIIDLKKYLQGRTLDGNFLYRERTGTERDEAILFVLKKIGSGELLVAREQMNKDYWTNYWGDILKDFLANGCDVTRLTPQYMRRYPFFRLCRNYVDSEDATFTTRWFDVLKTCLFSQYLREADSVYEFGCGPGHNLVLLAKLFPEKNLLGFDWVQPSADILTAMANEHHYRLTGGVFDIYSPDESIAFPPLSAVMTIHALEQIGPNFEPFLDFLLRKSPALCLHIEPIYELYDPDNLIDWLAMEFHRKRKYLDGFLTRLKELDERGVIELIKVQRVPFGSTFHDPYSYIVWRPLRKKI
ncbi:MAG: class I SAM-dependent methyltransferase [Minisyncoccia bacterium]|jgi:SAM-dependent methyltransferase